MNNQVQFRETYETVIERGKTGKVPDFQEYMASFKVFNNLLIA
jgi:hypothetical protein